MINFLPFIVTFSILILPSGSLLETVLLSLSVSVEAELRSAALRVDRREGRRVRDVVGVECVVLLSGHSRCALLSLLLILTQDGVVRVLATLRLRQSILKQTYFNKTITSLL